MLLTGRRSVLALTDEIISDLRTGFENHSARQLDLRILEVVFDPLVAKERRCSLKA